jgi:hypothetical protein
LQKAFFMLVVEIYNDYYLNISLFLHSPHFFFLNLLTEN